MNRAKVFFRVAFLMCFALMLTVPTPLLAMGSPAGEEGEAQNTSGGQAGTPVAVKPKTLVEVVFVLDTTGSMHNLIEGAKKKIWSIANTIVDQNPDAEIRMGLVGYRDLDDVYVTMHYPLTTDIQAIYGHLLTFGADGGGDTPESVNEALDVALGKLGWSDKPVNAEPSEPATAYATVNRILFLVGDAPPHMDYQQDRKYPQIIAEAVQRGIIVNTVQAGDMESTEQVWRDMAVLGKGEYMRIPQDGGTVVIIVTPYDEEINIIQRNLNKTIVPYGSVIMQSEVRSKAEMYEKAAPSSSADMASYVNKSGKGMKIVTGGGDLVADIQSGSKKLAEVPEAELPENLRKLGPVEREAYIAEQIKQRAELGGKLAAQVKQRDEFIKNKETEAAAENSVDSFDANVSRTLKNQIK